jgi:hypothetical protein
MNLEKIVRQRLLNDMINLCRANTSEMFVLVLDDYTKKIVFSCFDKSEMISIGILIVRKICSVEHKEKYDTGTIYFLSPTTENVDALIADASAASAHVFFSLPIPSESVAKIRRAFALIPNRIKHLVDLNLDFKIEEPQAFTIGGDLRKLYLPDRKSTQAEEVFRIYQHLTSFLITLGKVPYIRAHGELAKQVAGLIDRNFTSSATAPTTKSAQLLILDRSMDPFSPFIHNFSYKSAIHDLDDSDGEPSSHDDRGDFLMLKLRHQHIAIAQDTLKTHFQDFYKTNNAAMRQAGLTTSEPSSELLRKIAMDIPAFKKETTLFSKHRDSLLKCFDAIKHPSIEHVADLEQTIATEVDQDGVKISLKTIKTMLVNILQGDATVFNKIRILMMYCGKYGLMSDGVRKELLKSIDPRLHHAFINFSKIFLPQDMVEHEVTVCKEDKLRFSRFVPAISEIFEKFCLYTLNVEKYSFIGEVAIKPPYKGVSDRKKKMNAEQKLAAEEKKIAENPIFIVFILGGMTCSEIKAVHEMGTLHQVNFFLGSTNIISPNKFVEHLSGEGTYGSLAPSA